MAAFTPPATQLSGGSCAHAFAITPNDTTVFSNLTLKIYVGGAGNLAVVLAGDTNPVTFTAVPAGITLDLCAQKVMATNTTATAIVGMY